MGTTRILFSALVLSILAAGQAIATPVMWEFVATSCINASTGLPCPNFVVAPIAFWMIEPGSSGTSTFNGPVLTGPTDYSFMSADAYAPFHGAGVVSWDITWQDGAPLSVRYLSFVSLLTFSLTSASLEPI
jgi:hypothetical protein